MTALALILQLLPPNRGELNIAQFAENYNSYADYFDMDFGGYYFSEEGQWAERPEDGVYYINILEQPKLVYQYTLDGEHITGVAFSMEVEGEQGFLSYNRNEMLLSALAFGGAQEGFLTSGFPEWIDSTIREYGADSFSVSRCGLDICCSVLKKGYVSFVGTGSVLFPETDCSNQYFSQQFSIVKQQ